MSSSPSTLPGIEYFKNSLKFWALTKRGVKTKKQKINKRPIFTHIFSKYILLKNIVKPIFPQSQWPKRNKVNVEEVG
jgi:hypothetical protein